MLRADGSQKRSVGGIFFTLMRDDLGSKDFYRIFKGGQQQRIGGGVSASFDLLQKAGLRCYR